MIMDLENFARKRSCGNLIDPRYELFPEYTGLGIAATDIVEATNISNTVPFLMFKVITNSSFFTTSEV